MDGSVIIKAVLDTTDVRKNVSGLKNDLKGITWNDLTQGTEKAYSLGRSFQSAGLSMTASVTAPLAFLGKSAFDAAVAFESSFAGVRKTVEATEEEFDALAEASRRMSEVKPVSANDINHIMELGGQLGIATENLEEFAGVVADLDVSTDLGIEQAATQMSQYANITGMAKTDFDRFGSTIVALGNTTATTESAIMEMAHRIAGAGSQVGLTDDQILALSASLSSVGIEAEAGGTAISTVMSQIDKDVALNTEAVQTWAQAAGMSAEEFAHAWEGDPITALQALFSGMNDASSSGENMNLMLDELGVTSLRQTDMMKRLSGASDVLTESVDTASAAWEENTALTNEAEERYGTTESQMQIFNNKMENIAETLGGPLMEAFNAALDIIEPFINFIKDVAKAFAEAPEPIQILVVALGGIAAAAGPILFGLGSLIGFINPLSNGLSLLKGGFSALNSVLKANPILLIVGLIAGLIVWLIDLYNTNEEFRAGVDAAWASISEAFSAAWDFIVGVFEDFMGWLGEVGQGFTDFGNWVGRMWDGFVSDVDTAVGDAESALGDFGSWMESFDPMQSLVDVTQSAIREIDSVFPGFGRTVEDVITSAQTFFDDPYASLENATRSVTRFMSDNFPDFTKTVSEVISSVQGFFADPFAPLRDAVNNILNWWSQYFQLPSIQWPSFNLPHPYISPAGWQIGDLLKGSIPSIGISWYAKGGVFNGASVIGVGEAGPEAVVPLSGPNMKPFADAIAANINATDKKTEAPIYVTIENFNNYDTKQDVDTISRLIATNINTEMKARGIA